MALNFLIKSPTYASKTKDEILKRRQAICQQLNDSYKAGKNKNEKIFKLITNELASEGAEITKNQYHGDKVIFRSVFLWLKERDESKKEELAKKSPQARGVIKYLQADNINFWSDLKLDEVPAVPPAEIAEEPVDPYLALKQKLAGHQAVGKVLSSAYQLLADLDPLIAENENLKEELQGLLISQKDYEPFLQFVEEENAALEERLREAKDNMRHAHSAALEEIATEHPEYPELFIIAQKLKQSPAQWQVQFNNLTAQLPQTFTWRNDTGSMVYGRHFLGRLAKLQQYEQDQVIKQVKNLSAEGPEYHSLETRKNEPRLPFSPAGCMSSRGSDVWRFSWKKNGGITIHALYRKSDTRLRQSEA